MDVFNLRWLVGFVGVALVLGGIVAGLIVYGLRKWRGLTPPKNGIPSWLTGLLERLVLTIIVAFNVPAAAIAMIGWITVKMFTSWNRPGRTLTEKEKLKNPRFPEESPEEREFRLKEELRLLAFTALIGSLVSMFFALIGGLVCNGTIWF